MGLDNWGSHREFWRIKNAFQEALNPGVEQRICRRLAAVLVDCSFRQSRKFLQHATGRGEMSRSKETRFFPASFGQKGALGDHGA